MIARLAITLLLALMCASASASEKVLLVVTHTTGFRHDSIPTAEKVIGELAAAEKQFRVEYCRNLDDVKKMMSPEGLRQWDGVFFVNTNNDIGVPDLDYFLNWIRSGKAFCGAHAASGTYRTAQLGDSRFVDMVGGEFKNHGRQCEVEMLIDDPDHPATRHFGLSWKLFEEIYHFHKPNRKDVRVLLSLDRHPDDGLPGANQPGDFPLSWVKRYGAGRVFYTALGHRDDVWANPDFQKHILGGMRWTLGLDRGLAIPGIPQPARK